MPVVSGSSGRGVASSLAPLMGMQYIELESPRFPDGEGYVRVPTEAIDAVRSEPVVLVSNTYPHSGVVSTLLLLEAIADVRRGDLSNLKGEEPQSMDDVGGGVFSRGFRTTGTRGRTSASPRVRRSPRASSPRFSHAAVTASPSSICTSPRCSRGWTSPSSSSARCPR
ncbi:MAG: hypothetical protein Ct9H300mP10_10610 [Methanobacteriota archaeon]|nr:MAG: hypothetical protein Ct9H300mP10_10610 [Euryarchaeota archaeon]